MFSYPLQVHPCRASLDAVSKWRPKTSRRQDLTSASGSPGAGGHKSSIRSQPEEMSETRFALITTIIIILSYIVAMTVSSLDKVLAYVGSTGSTSISFILPGLFYYKISSPNSPHHQRLLKDEDDEEYEGSDESGEETLLEQDRNSWRSAFNQLTRGKQWSKNLIRRLALALSIYGLIVMVTCLVINTYFNVAH